ncbi:MAG: hypothetical protein COT90_04150 [Candidatus Diapherotrites archaeon CG10_big_fil_rev_8_21_14_0_10_31_34]|nr:MAG: hypothetical protein COT90_04150 [Candidatus Diapherotrites archaeon CG10_big_fil_rev_8_21_14_0_10_31_34]
MNSKILIGAVIIVVVIAGAWFFTQGEKKEMTFSEGVNEINLLWEKNNVNPKFLVADSTEASFTASDLESLNNDLISFQDSLNKFNSTEETKALTDFVQIHFLLVDELVLALETKNASDRLELTEITGDNLCNNKTDLKLVGENTIKLNEKMSSVNELVYAFNEVHPNLEETANLSSFIVSTADFSRIELENTVMLNELERVC